MEITIIIKPAPPNDVRAKKTQAFFSIVFCCCYAFNTMIKAGEGTASSNMYKIQKQNQESPSMESKMLANAKPPYYRKGKHDQESRSNSEKKSTVILFVPAVKETQEYRER